MISISVPLSVVVFFPLYSILLFYRFEDADISADNPLFSSQVEKIQERIKRKEFSRQMFDEVHRVVLNLINSNYWVEFKSSKYCKEDELGSDKDAEKEKKHKRNSSKSSYACLRNMSPPPFPFKINHVFDFLFWYIRSAVSWLKDKFSKLGSPSKRAEKDDAS